MTAFKFFFENEDDTLICLLKNFIVYESDTQICALNVADEMVSNERGVHVQCGKKNNVETALAQSLSLVETWEKSVFGN